jgi:hypothetical protein
MWDVDLVDLLADAANHPLAEDYLVTKVAAAIRAAKAAAIRAANPNTKRDKKRTEAPEIDIRVLLMACIRLAGLNPLSWLALRGDGANTSTPQGLCTVMVWEIMVKGEWVTATDGDDVKIQLSNVNPIVAECLRTYRTHFRGASSSTHFDCRTAMYDAPEKFCANGTPALNFLKKTLGVTKYMSCLLKGCDPRGRPVCAIGLHTHLTNAPMIFAPWNRVPLHLLMV